MTTATIWGTLGLAPTRDTREIRRAYAQRLKTTHPEDNPTAFHQLRAAYEAALGLANQVEHGDTGDARDGSGGATAVTAQSATIVESVAAAEPDAADTLRTAFRRLHEAVYGEVQIDAVRLRALLKEVIDAAAQGNVALQQETEFALAHLIASTVPRSDDLLDECIRRFQWERQDQELAPNPAVMAVVQRRGDLAALIDLKTRTDVAGVAYRRLTHKANPFIRWVRANFIEARRWPELGLLTGLKDRHPALLQHLDAAEVAWWEKFFSTPQLSYGYSRLGAVLAVVAGIVGFSAAPPPIHPLAGAALSFIGAAALILALLVGKLYLLDWPTLKIDRRWRGKTPVFLQIGFLPILVAMLLMLAAVGESPVLKWLALIIGAGTGIWAILVSGPMPSAIQSSQILIAHSHVMQLFVLNLFLGPWWLLASTEFDSTAFDQNRIAAFALMAASALGQRSIYTAWCDRLTTKARMWIVIAFSMLAIPLAYVVFVCAARSELRPLCAALVVSYVVCHRVPLADLDWQKRKIQLYVAFALYLGFMGTLKTLNIDVVASVLQLTAPVVLTAAGINLALAAFGYRNLMRQ